MKRLMVLFAVVLLIASVVPANAWKVDVELNCPEVAYSGTPLDVSATLSNYYCDSVSLSKAIVALGGNSGGTLGALGLYGPYPRPFVSPVIIGAAQCDHWGNPIRPRRVTVDVNIVSSVPASLVDTMAGAAVTFIRTDNEEEGGDACVIEVAP
jgi:hypothetical protein